MSSLLLREKELVAQMQNSLLIQTAESRCENKLFFTHFNLSRLQNCRNALEFDGNLNKIMGDMQRSLIVSQRVWIINAECTTEPNYQIVRTRDYTIDISFNGGKAPHVKWFKINSQKVVLSNRKFKKNDIIALHWGMKFDSKAASKAASFTNKFGTYGASRDVWGNGPSVFNMAVHAMLVDNENYNAVIGEDFLVKAACSIDEGTVIRLKVDGEICRSIKTTKMEKNNITQLNHGKSLSRPGTKTRNKQEQEQSDRGLPALTPDSDLCFAVYCNRMAWLLEINRHKTFDACPLLLTGNYNIDIDFSPDTELQASEWLRLSEGFLYSCRQFNIGEAIIYLTDDVKCAFRGRASPNNTRINAVVDESTLRATEEINPGDCIMFSETF